jgi:hypothetical protein
VLESIHMYVNVKMVPVETIEGIGGRGDKADLWKE